MANTAPDQTAQAAPSPDSTGERIRVLELKTTLGQGGATEVMVSLANHLPRSEFEVTVAAGPEFGGKLSARMAEDVNLWWCRHLHRKFNLPKDLAALVELARFMREQRFDIVHCHSSKAGALGRIAALLAGVRNRVFTVHGWSFYRASSPWKRRIYVLIEKLLALATSAYVLVSHSDLAAGMAEKICGPANSLVVPNGVDLPRVDARAESVLGPLAPPEGCLAVGMVGRLFRQKQPLVFLAAAGQALSQRDDLRFYFVGDGEMQAECEDYISANGLEGKVHLLGNREDVPALLACFDIFLFTPAWEGLPLALMEAMFAGLPVVASDIPGNAELVAQGETGFLVPAGNPGAFAEKVLRLAGDIDLRRSMGEKGLARVRSRYSLEAMVNGYADLFKRLARGKAASVKGKP